VPAVYGLALARPARELDDQDRRGALRAHRPCPVREFICRNYASDSEGRWISRTARNGCSSRSITRRGIRLATRRRACRDTGRAARAQAVFLDDRAPLLLRDGDRHRRLLDAICRPSSSALPDVRGRALERLWKRWRRARSASDAAGQEGADRFDRARTFPAGSDSSQGPRPGRAAGC